MSETRASIERMVRCPRCRKPAHYHESNPWRPFCSERCKIIDVAAWADEEFRLDGGPADPDDYMDAVHRVSDDGDE